MYCKNCGAKIADDAKFCTECGTAVDQRGQQDAPKPTTPPIIQKRKKPITSRFWFWAVIVIVLYLGYTIYNTGSNQLKEQQSQARTEYGNQVFNDLMNENGTADNDIDIEISGCRVKYLSYEIKDDILAVYYQFENNSKEPKSFSLTVDDNAYQDGIELHFSWVLINGESKDADASIQPGVAIIVCKGYELRNTTSDVELTVGKWPSIDGKPSDSMTVSIA
jgi:hypothetical protein